MLFNNSMANFNAKRFGIQIIYRVCENQLWAPKLSSFEQRRHNFFYTTCYSIFFNEASYFLIGKYVKLLRKINKINVNV